MHSIMLALLLVSSDISSFENEKNLMCLHEERIKITKVYGRIELADRPPRVASIRVRLPVDCRSGAYLVPNNYEQAIEWLDISLPMDLKVALLDGEYANPFRTSNYGESVMGDLFFYITDRWKLTEASAVCAVSAIQDRIQPYETPCFFALIDILRETYLNGRGGKQKSE